MLYSILLGQLQWDGYTSYMYMLHEHFSFEFV